MGRQKEKKRLRKKIEGVGDIRRVEEKELGRRIQYTHTCCCGISGGGSVSMVTLPPTSAHILSVCSKSLVCRLGIHRHRSANIPLPIEDQ